MLQFLETSVMQLVQSLMGRQETTDFLVNCQDYYACLLLTLLEPYVCLAISPH